MNLILIGFKNCGKSTVGHALANKLHCEFVDTDDVLKDLYSTEKGVQLSIPEIHQTEGEAQFRLWETRALDTLRTIDTTIVSTGGGVVLKSENIVLLKMLGKIIYLKANVEELLKRQNATRVPTYLDENNPVDSFMQMYNIRRPLYETAADYSVEINDKHAPVIVEEIIQKIFE